MVSVSQNGQNTYITNITVGIALKHSLYDLVHLNLREALIKECLHLKYHIYDLDLTLTSEITGQKQQKISHHDKDSLLRISQVKSRPHATSDFNFCTKRAAFFMYSIVQTVITTRVNEYIGCVLSNFPENYV